MFVKFSTSREFFDDLKCKKRILSDDYRLQNIKNITFENNIISIEFKKDFSLKKEDVQTLIIENIIKDGNYSGYYSVVY